MSCRGNLAFKRANTKQASQSVMRMLIVGCSLELKLIVPRTGILRLFDTCFYLHLRSSLFFHLLHLERILQILVTSGQEFSTSYRFL